MLANECLAAYLVLNRILTMNKSILHGQNRSPIVRTYPTFENKPQHSQLLVKNLSLWLLLLPLISLLGIKTVQAQSIVPALDGTNTVVAPDGNSINISGGQLSGDNANLFHSFQKFGLNADQIANFLSNPSIQNILGRVVGGDPSIINGLIQITGGNSNLFLMNPAGIVFGSGARLDVPGAFTATTADGIGFGSNWFNASGANNFQDLVGNPDAFNFSMAEPGAILNFGELAVGQGQSLTLLGGTVVNTGTVTAPGGNITLTAVPGTNLVRISQEGQILSLEVELPKDQTGNLLPIQVKDLLGILVGLPLEVDKMLTVTSEGKVQLAESGTTIPDLPGTNIVSGKLDVSNPETGGVGGEINVLGDKIGLIGANVDASGINGGGTVLIGGDYKGQGTVPNASLTLIDSESVINANALRDGDGGKVIAWADKTTGFYGNISATGGSNSGDGGFVEISSQENLIYRGEVDVSTPNGNAGSLLLDPANITIVNGDGSVTTDDSQLTGDNQILFEDSPGATFTISENALEGLAGNATVTLAATNDITIEDLTDNNLTFASGPGGSINFNAGGAFSMNASDTIQARQRDINISGASITVGSIATLTPRDDLVTPNNEADGNGGSVTLQADGDIKVNGKFTTTVSDIELSIGTYVAAGGTGDGGDISLTSKNGSIFIATNDADIYSTTSLKGNSGDITLSAPNGNIELPDSISIVSKVFSGGSGNAGKINITANNINTGDLKLDASAPTGSTPGAINIDGNIQSLGQDISITGATINTGAINSSSEQGNGGAIALNANNNITTGSINSSAFGESGGKVILETTIGNIKTDKIDTHASGSIVEGSEAQGGEVLLNAKGSITTGTIDSFYQGANREVAQGGTVTLNSGNKITTGAINASAFSGESITFTEAGKVTLTSGGELEFSSINTEAFSFGGEYQGGDVDLTANGVIKGTETVSNSAIPPVFGSPPANTTILTEGGTSSGTISIQHNGGSDNVSFTVGNANVVNGTAGSINAGDNAVISTEEFPVLPNGGNAPDTPQGITITSVNSPPTLTANTELTGAKPNQPFKFTYEQLKTVIDDADSDNTSLIVDTINGTLKKNGQQVVEGTILSPGVYSYSPGDNVAGKINAFAIRASDKISNSAPQEIVINVEPQLNQDDRSTIQKPGEPINFPLPDTNVLLPVTVDPTVAATDDTFTGQYESYLGVDKRSRVTLDKAREILLPIEKATGTKPAIIYVTFLPLSNQLELVLVTSKGEPIHKIVSTPTIVSETVKDTPIRQLVSTPKRSEVLKVAKAFQESVSDPLDEDYLKPAQQLYQWIVKPLEADLQAQGVNNLLFITDEGLRSIPLAALYDGKNYLIEKYSIGFTPSLSLTDTRYTNIKNFKAIAMGASIFQDLGPLPAVPKELSLVAQEWHGKFFLNQGFTLNNLKSVNQNQQFGIIHLATHGEFKKGEANNSYIQLWDQKLRLPELRQLQLYEIPNQRPPVELLVLSACETALGDKNAELGFGGLAAQTGAKTVIASLWQVDDAGTLGLMTEFYSHLKTANIKSEALRQAQIAMLTGETYVENGQLITRERKVVIPSESQASQLTQALKHPYYWSGFTMIGNPW